MRGLRGRSAWSATFVGGGLFFALAMMSVVGTQNSQTDTRTHERRRQQFTLASRFVDDEGPAEGGPKASEALTGFDHLTNGFDEQGPDFDMLTEENVMPLRSFNDNRFIFEEVETAEDGLGPTYNAQSCRECHQNVVTGGASQVAEHRTGRMLAGEFYESLGGSLVHSRAIYEDLVEVVATEDDIRTFRISTTTLGAGYVEAVANSTLVALRDSQPADMRGTAVVVPVLEANGVARVGRFGWKNQHASLVSFAADAFLNEIGITTPLLPTDNTSNGNRMVNGVPVDDGIRDPEDDGEAVQAFARFMRSTKAPPRNEVLATTFDVEAGTEVFSYIGCALCHRPDITTAPAGTVVNGGAFVVPPALGDKIIHPFSDFLLHTIETGDGIVQNGGQESRYWLRTAPLWGLRTRDRFMHDGLSVTIEDAIMRHKGQAGPVVRNYVELPPGKKQQLLAFLRSL